MEVKPKRGGEMVGYQITNNMLFSYIKAYYNYVAIP